MDVQAIQQLIGSLGFPIVACGAMFVQNWHMSKNHKEETKAMTDALNNNTLALTQLKDTINK